MHPAQEVAREELTKQMKLVETAWQAVLNSPEYANWTEQCKRLTDAQERDEQAELKAWFSSNRAK